MTVVEAGALYAAIAAYTLAFGVALFSYIFESRRAANFSLAAILLAFAAQTLSIGLRWASVGHPPVFGAFENGLAGSWFVVLFSLIIFWRRRPLLNMNMAVSVMAVAILWFGTRFDESKFPLTISERSLWVDFHVTLAWLAYAALTAAFILALAIIFQKERLFVRWAKSSPPVSVEELSEEFMARYVSYGFIMLTATLATGSYYEFLAFGHWWRWDPVESLTLACWFVLALFIHLKRSFGWRARPLAWLVVLSFALSIIIYWLLIYFPGGATFHIFDIGRREHVI